MVTFRVFTLIQPQVARTRRTHCPLTPLLHSTPLLPIASAVFSLTAHTEPFSFQSLSHSFYRHGGVPPSAPSFWSAFSSISFIFHYPAASKRTHCAISCPERDGGVRTNCALTSLFITRLPRKNSRRAQKQGGGEVSVDLTRTSALTLKPLLARSYAHLVRSFHSFTKECSRTLLQPTRSALFFKTAGCAAISNQIPAPETFLHPPSYLLQMPKEAFLL